MYHSFSHGPFIAYTDIAIKNIVEVGSECPYLVPIPSSMYSKNQQTNR